MRKEAKDLLLKQAEKLALKENILILDALERVVNDKTNFQLVLTAMGGHWKARPPCRRTLRNWVPKRKDHPAYIPPFKRKKGGISRERQAGKTVKQIADEQGVSRQTIYNRLKKEKCDK